jgi:DNA-binding CsgD family transcriptional regulator
MGPPPMQPLMIVQGPEDALAAVVAEVRAGGAGVRRGWESSATIPAGRLEGTVFTGVIATDEEASAALLLAARGAGLVVAVHETTAEGAPLLPRFFEDLRHLGPVTLRGVEPLVPSASLDPEQAALLELLARGTSVADAARELHVSRRTAQRRLVAARQALGVRTTAEAVIVARRSRPTGTA